MALVDFTSYDDIRAALGVSTDELEDITLSLPLYELNLTAAFEEVSLDLVDTFKALPSDSSTWTTVQKRFNDTTRLYAIYSVARHLTISLPLFSPKEISDGKAHTTRYSQDPYKSTIEGIVQQFDAIKVRLISAFAAAQSTVRTTAPSRVWMSVATPASDPVTGT